MADYKNGSGMSFSSFLLGAIIGGLAGAAYALLKAPQSGDKTRLQIREIANDLQNKTDRALSSAVEHGKTAADKVALHAKVIKEEAVKAVDEAIEEGKATIEETKSIAKESKKDVLQQVEGTELEETM